MTEPIRARGPRPLRELRAERLLTIRDLARAVDVDPAMIADVEGGRATAAPELLGKIAVILDVEPAAIAELGAPSEGTPSASRPARVLIVDDDDRMRSLLSRVLDDTGYAIRTATNGAEALAFLPAWRPDVILLDLNMPIMDGRVFCLELERQPAFATIPIVVVSSDERHAPCRPAAYVAKPFSPGVLLDTIAAVLAARSTVGEPG